jgi:hypothetical protein
MPDPIIPPATPPATPPAEPDDLDGAPSSADVAGSRSARLIRKLETRISVLEDSNKTILGENKSLKEKIEVLAKIPAPGQPGKSLLQQLDEFCFKRTETPKQ